VNANTANGSEQVDQVNPTGQQQKQDAGGQQTSQQGAGGKQKTGADGGKQDQKGSKPHPGTSDVVATTFSSVPLSSTAVSGSVMVDLDKLEQALKELKNKKSITWDTNNELFEAVDGASTIQLPGAKSSVSCITQLSASQAYVFHVKWWTNDAANPLPGGQLVSSDWYAYHQSGANLVRDKLSGSGDPIIYGAKGVLIVGIDMFDTYVPPQGAQPIRYSGRLSTKYQVTVVQGTPANWSNLGSLASGLLGLHSAQTAAGPGGQSGYIAVACQKGTKTLPFDVAINETVIVDSADQAKAPAMPAAGNVACSGSSQNPPCAMSRTFTSTDKEYWDVSMGVAIPGVRETGFTFSTTSNTATPKATTHTEAYAFVDLYLAAAKASKDSLVPHINLGLPVASKSLYRPYFGLAENLTGSSSLQQKMQLPTGVSVFAGMCWMKTQQLVGPTPTTQAAFSSDLKYHHVWKPMFGIEVSVSALASKLGGKSKNANGTTSTTKGSGSGS